MSEACRECDPGAPCAAHCPACGARPCARHCPVCQRMSKDAGLPNVCAAHLPPPTESADDCPRCAALSIGFDARIPCRVHAPAAPAAAPAPAGGPRPREGRQPAPAEPASGMHVRVDLDATRLHATMADLAPLSRLAAAGGLRALPAAPRDGQTGGTDPHLFVDLMHDRGDAARARLAHRRLLLVHPALRETLLWLADRGEMRPTVREAAGLYARECGPIELRDAVDRARAAREAADREHGKALRKAKRVLTVEVARARDLVTQRQREEGAAGDTLVAWGHQHLALACAQWHSQESSPDDSQVA